MQSALSLWWALAIGAGGATLIAVTVSAQIYLSMLHHGHSFLRIVVWQLCTWSVWVLATPVVLRLGARLTDRTTSLPRAVARITATALLIVSAHILVSSVATVALQPYVP